MKKEMNSDQTEGRKGEKNQYGENRVQLGGWMDGWIDRNDRYTNLRFFQFLHSSLCFYKEVRDGKVSHSTQTIIQTTKTV